MTPSSTCTLPLVSVVLPAYNAAPFIRRTLESVLAQTYEKLEVLVVDDGSTDATIDIVKEMAARDQRVVLLRQPNRGVAAARNLAIEVSRGEFIAPIDADDIWYPHKIERQVECLTQAGPSVGVVYCWWTRIDEDDRITGYSPQWTIEGNVFMALIYRNFVGNASLPLIRRAALDRVGLYDPGLKAQDAQGCEDRDIYLRLAERYEFRVVPDYLMGYRKVSTSMSRNHLKMLRSYNLVAEAIRSRHPEVPEKVFRWSQSHFYMYIANTSASCGHHGDAIRFTMQAISTDPVLLTSIKPLKLLLNSSLKLVAKGLGLPASGWRSRLRGMKRARVQTQTDIKDGMAAAVVTPVLQRPKGLYERISRYRLKQMLDLPQPNRARYGGKVLDRSY
jgi:glycosyltransferase involved in cell wall biosynthesis